MAMIKIRRVLVDILVQPDCSRHLQVLRREW
jgi:hypothetical protein